MREACRHVEEISGTYICRVFSTLTPLHDGLAFKNVNDCFL